jgi:hypothetical protein
MEQKKKIFLLIGAVICIVFLSPVLITAFVKNQTINFIVRSLLVFLAIYLVLEIINRK